MPLRQATMRELTYDVWIAGEGKRHWTHLVDDNWKGNERLTLELQKPGEHGLFFDNEWIPPSRINGIRWPATPLEHNLETTEAHHNP